MTHTRDSAFDVQYVSWIVVSMRLSGCPKFAIFNPSAMSWQTFNSRTGLHSKLHADQLDPTHPVPSSMRIGAVLYARMHIHISPSITPLVATGFLRVSWGICVACSDTGKLYINTCRMHITSSQRDVVWDVSVLFELYRLHTTHNSVSNILRICSIGDSIIIFKYYRVYISFVTHRIIVQSYIWHERNVYDRHHPQKDFISL